MMKNVYLLLSSAILTICSVGAVSPSNATIRTFKCTPFYLNGDKSLMTFDVLASKKDPLLIEIYIVNPLYPDGILLEKINMTSMDVVNYSYDNSYTYASENKIEIRYYAGREKRKSFSHNIDVANGSNYVLNDTIFNFSTSYKNYSYSVEENRWTLNSEKYTFYNFENSYIPSFYHKIDLSDFYIKTNSTFKNNITYKDAMFCITNRNNFFDKFEHDKTFAYMPVKLTKRSSKYILSFENDLFVEPLTLQMSPTHENGYVKTSYLYFPRNEKRFEEEYQCMIAINNLGIDKSSFVTRFKYKSLLNTFGDCRNSEFCIVNHD